MTFGEYQADKATTSVNEVMKINSGVDPKITAEFRALLAATPKWHKPGLVDQDGFVTLPNVDPDTVAGFFQKWSLDVCKVRHRYNSIDGWTIYYKDKYQRVEDEKEIKGYVRLFINKHCKISKKIEFEDEDGNTKKKTTLVKTDKTLKTVSFVNNVVEQLRVPGGGVHLLPSQKVPCSLDGTLDANHTLAMANGLLDRSKHPYKLQPLSDQFYTLNYMDYDYLPDEISEIWGDFILEITDQDPDMTLLLQQWAGYLLMPTNKYQKFMLCVGDGANGKGVFFDTLTAAIGRANVSNVPLACFTESAKIYATYGKMVNMSNESAKHLEESAESVIKEYVGGDKMVWERKYKDAFSDYPTAKLMFATNELPTIHDASDGIWRRMIYVPFDRKFTGDQQNEDLCLQLQQPKELAGILNWMLEGAESLEAGRGFILPQRCVDGLAQYKSESNPTQSFINEHLEAGDYDDKIPKSEVYKLYHNWCKDNGCYAKNNAHFGRAMKKAFTRSEVTREPLLDKRVYFYRGIKVQEGIETSPGKYPGTMESPSKDEVTGVNEIPF